MKGNKKTFKHGNKFYKQFDNNEYELLSALHENTGFTIGNEIVDGDCYITMDYGHAISIDTIAREKRSSPCIQSIIYNNMDFIISQIVKLNDLNIYYSDCLQFVLTDRMYLIDMDTSYRIDKIDYNHDNIDLLENFLGLFGIDYKWIDSIRYTMHVFKSEGETFFDHDMKIYNKYRCEGMLYKYCYYSRNTRHIQLKDGICVYSEDIGRKEDGGIKGNIFMCDSLLNENSVDEWELIRIV